MNPVKTFMFLVRLAVAGLAVVLAGCAALTPDFITAAERGTVYRSVIYKAIGEDELRIHLFFPAGHRSFDRCPAIVFFHGGGWYGGSPEQFFPHCRYLAYRGMVAASAEYRVEGRHATTPPSAMADGNSAIRWLRSRAGELGIDPEKLAAGGGSAGGHLAATAAMSSGFDDPADDLEISPVPDALVLFNPALDVNFLEGPKAFGGRAQEASPIYLVRPGLPPTIIFQGTEDHTVPYQTAALFTNLMKESGNECILVTFRGLGHGFFNYGEKGNRPFRQTLWATDRFLTEQGFLEGEPPFTPGPARFDRESAGKQ